MSSRSRNKGHRLERMIAKIFRERLGFSFAKTSRAASRLLDSCKIDLAFVPFNIQCKDGYDNNRPKYERLYNECKEELKKNFPKDDPIHNQPYVVIHKINERVGGRFTWTFRHEDIVEILEEYFNQKQIIKNLENELNELKSR